MARPVRFNTNVKELEAPEGHMGEGFIQMIVFMTMLMLGFYYVIKKGILKWE